MATIDLTHEDIYKEMRSFLVEIFKTQAVIRGNQNGSPLPEDAVVMNIIHDSNIGTSLDTYDKEAGLTTVQQSKDVLMQVDCYGDSAQPRSSMLSVLWKDSYSTNKLTKCQPLYIENLRHAPFVNEKSMYEDRYIVELRLQYNPSVTHDQAYVDDVEIILNQI